MTAFSYWISVSRQNNRNNTLYQITEELKMKKLMMKKGSTCMACLECVRACSEAFYKELHGK